MNSKSYLYPKVGRRKRLVFFTLLIMIVFGTVIQTTARAEWIQKVDPWVLETAVADTETEFLIVLDQQADLTAVANITDKTERGTVVYAQLTAVAQQTQAPIIAELEAANVPYQRFWVTNMIWARGKRALITKLAQRTDVAHIYANPTVKLDIIAGTKVEREIQSIPWGITITDAPAVWAAGVTGQGVVIGGQDTGYDWQHPALKPHYRGWDGTTADHGYNWHDAIHADNPGSNPGNPCGFDLLEPCDDHGHGTHTMGTMVGDDGMGNQIGMAPGAKWIACRNMEQGWGTPASYSECYEWFIAPYPQGADPFTDGDPSKAPHVINNSWSCTASEGCTDPDVLKPIVENVNLAGIVTVHSAGNSGSSCSTVTTPAAIYDVSFTVGATDSSDTIAAFSSRGPVTVGDNNPAKPDISAPGVAVYSSILGGGYGTLSGTSMAAPHVAGLVALLISANPDLAGDVEALELAIMQTAVARTSDQGCGGDSSTAVPNHVYGWGRIDDWTAYESVIVPPVSQELIFLPVLLNE